MPTMRPAAAWLRGACAAALLAAAASSTAAAQQGDRYPATIQFGTGLVTIPVAWVSPNNTDAWLNTSGRYTPTFPDSPVKQGFASLWNTNIAVDVHLLQRFSLGVAAYDQNIDFGFFGQALLLRDNQFSGMPAIAVGFRNLGNCKIEDRMLLGCDVVATATSGSSSIATRTSSRGRRCTRWRPRTSPSGRPPGGCRSRRSA